MPAGRLSIAVEPDTVVLSVFNLTLVRAKYASYAGPSQSSFNAMQAIMVTSFIDSEWPGRATGVPETI